MLEFIACDGGRYGSESGVAQWKRAGVLSSEAGGSKPLPRYSFYFLSFSNSICFFILTTPIHKRCLSKNISVSIRNSSSGLSEM